MNPNLERILNTPFLEFHSDYSTVYGAGGIFGGTGGVYQTTTELNYARVLNDLSTDGGIHLAVAGGLDPVLGQIAKTKPELTILCDINICAMQVIYRRLLTLSKAENGQEYWRLAREIFMRNAREGFGLPVINTDSDTNSGWSSSQYYPVVREAWQRGAVKFINADITGYGLTTVLALARRTGIPIKLLHLSNIFDYPSNQSKRPQLALSLTQGIEEELVDPKAQVVEATVEKDMASEVFPITSYLGRLRKTA